MADNSTTKDRLIRIESKLHRGNLEVQEQLDTLLAELKAFREEWDTFKREWDEEGDDGQNSG